jgi:sugar/nucleoside kinase (ribokinase family)
VTAEADRPGLIVVGDVMLDVSVQSGELAAGGDVHGGVRVRPGGAGANAAAWAASSGARVTLFGAVGDDLSGRLLAQALMAAGVDARLAIVPGARTGAMLVVREAGERSMVADRGANACLSPALLPERLRADAVLVSGYLLFDPRSEGAAAAGLERAEAAHVAVDAASWPLIAAYGPARFFEATRSATVLLANEPEALTLTGTPTASPEEAARELGRRYPMVCVKRGPGGALLVQAGVVLASPAPAVTEVDPTGAGDAFDGAFLAALAAGVHPGDALALACEQGSRAAASAENWPGG